MEINITLDKYTNKVKLQFLCTGEGPSQPGQLDSTQELREVALYQICMEIFHF